MTNMLEYKGYYAQVEYDNEEKLLYGKIAGIGDLVTFDSETAAGLEPAFQEAVDDYLDFCKEVGKTPDKTYKGTFNVRVNPELHKQAAITAARRGISLNQFVANAISAQLSPA